MELTTSSLKENIYTSLSIQVRLDGLSFFTQNPASKELGVYDSIGFRQNALPSTLVHLIEDAFKSHPALSKKFTQVQIIYDSELYTVVPLPLFERKNASDYLKFSTKILSTDFVAYDELPSEDKVVVYIPYTNVNNYFFDKYGSFNFYHSITLFLKYVLQSSILEPVPKVIAHIKNGSFDLAIIKDQKLALINSYRISTSDDFLYYILFAYEQLGLDTNEIPLTFIGAISAENSIYKKAYQYIRHCNIAPHHSPIIQREDLLLATLL